MNKNFTDQQKRISTYIQQLINGFEDYISISLVRKIDARSSNSQCAATIGESRTKVNVVLIEAENSAELDVWAETLVKAEELLQQLQNERMHQLDTPDFFKYIILANQNYFKRR